MVVETQTLPLGKNKVRYGCIHQPLFPSILIDRVIPDILHLFLRISDVVINLLILDLRTMDGIEKLKNNEFNQTATRQLNAYITCLNECCKIPFHMNVTIVHHTICNNYLHNFIAHKAISIN